MTDLRAVFAWSYQALSGAAARVFRLFGVHPGPDIAGNALASVAGIDPAEMTRALRRGAPIPDDQLPLQRLSIAEARAELRRGHWFGYGYAGQLALTTGDGWFTSLWLVLTSSYLLLLVVGIGREMAFRYWESGVAGRTTDRLDSHPPSVESANRPTGTTDGG